MHKQIKTNNYNRKTMINNDQQAVMPIIYKT